jgi:hypothetical protein
MHNTARKHRGGLEQWMVILPLIVCRVGSPMTDSPASRPADTMAIGDSACRIEFDSRTGGLSRLVNLQVGDDCLKGGQPGGMPFRIYADLNKDFEIRINDRFQLVFDDPAAIGRTIVRPDTCRLTGVDHKGGLVLHYVGQGLTIRLHVRMESTAGTSDWSLRITNSGAADREFLTCFPCLDGVRPGTQASRTLATAMDQAGLIVPAWERPGGVLGESNQMSMQWHAIWNPATRSAIGLIFMDPNVLPKRLALTEPRIELHHFPPIRLGPGESVDMPPIRVLIYPGDWRPAARAYRAWYDLAYPHVQPPAWFLQSNGLNGIHVRKAGPGIASGYTGQVVLDSFRDLAAAHIRSPIDNWEYAFYCRTSMLTKDLKYTPHTDGENIIREDLGGPEAMRDGIAGLHRLGLHATLYVEGYIVPGEGELTRSGKAQRWAIMHKDGSLRGPYTRQGFHHMCPGCVEWQDHLAEMVARLIRQTGADGIRLDSLGFYYWPCYNPAHRHASPFGYNDWLNELLAKVRKAAVAVKPDVLLLTEGPADWVGQWFHGALTSRCPRDLSPMRLAVGPFRPCVYASGALWGSLSGFAGGDCTGSDVRTVDWNWLCARFPVHEALVGGDVADDDPQPSDPQVVARRFEGKGYWAIVAARPACQDPLLWPRGTGVGRQHAEYTLTLPGLASQVEQAALCDVETLTWTPLPVERQDRNIRLRLRTNWGLVILQRPGGPGMVAFDPLPRLQRGESTTFCLKPLSQPAAGLSRNRARVTAPGLSVTPSAVAVPGEVTITVPPDALPGNYAVSARGTDGGNLGIRRFVVVE